MSTGLNIRKVGALDFLSLGALIHRLDPGIIPFRKATQCQIHVSGGDCAGADLPLAETVAALVGPSALGWLISLAVCREPRRSSLGRRTCPIMRGRSNTTISLAAANAVAPKPCCSRKAAKASQGGLMLSNMPMKLTKAGQLFCGDCVAGVARPLR